MSRILAALQWVFGAFGRVLQLVVSLPSVVFAGVVGFVQSAILVVNGFGGVVDTISGFVNELVVNTSMFAGIVESPFFKIVCYCLALDKFANGVAIVFGAFFFLDFVLALVVIEYFLPVAATLIATKTVLRLSKSILPQSWSPELDIDCPDLLQIEIEE